MAKAKSDSGLSKMKMVESALDTHGDDASPADIQPWIKETYGTEIDRQMISSYASQIRKKRRGGASGSIKISGSSAGNGSVSVKDIHAIKDLISKHGSAELVSLVKVLSK